MRLSFKLLTLATALASGAAAGQTPAAAPPVVADSQPLAGARIAARTDTARLSAAFTALVLAVAAYTAVIALPALA